jgi:hypothetical protein
MMKRLVHALIALLLPLLAGVAPSLAFWTPDGDAVCTAGGTQANPVTVSDGAGGTIVVWQDYRSTTNYDIYAQRLNAAGTPQWAANGVVVCTATDNQTLPVVAADGLGGAIIAWQDFRDGAYWRVYAQRVNASGVGQWSPDGRWVCPFSGFNQQAPAIVAGHIGYAIIAWVDYRNDVSGQNTDIYAQQLDGSGNLTWGSGRSICTAGFTQVSLAAVTDGAYGAIIAWRDWRSTTNWDIYAQRVNESGGMWWTTNGIPVCTVSGNQEAPKIASDGAGATIVTWQDTRAVNKDIYAQRLNGNGVPSWTGGGIGVCTVSGDQSTPAIVADGAGGAIIAWRDYRNGNDDIFAQQLNVSGSFQWTAQGTSVCTDAGGQTSPVIVSDGSGGATIGWVDDRSGTHNAVFVQRMDAAGAPQWAANGVAICAAVGDQQGPALLQGGTGGAVIAWQDYRSASNWDIYAQMVDGNGRRGYLPARVLSVLDVPEDQGGWVRLTIDKSALDGDGEDYQIVTYNVWQQIDNLALLEAAVAERDGGQPVEPGKASDAALAGAAFAMKSAGWPVTELAGRVFLQSGGQAKSGTLPPGDWELIGSFAACQQNQYIYRASTLADAVGSEIPYSVYIVSAHTTSPSTWYASESGSGYSVDNLPPATPEGLVAGARYAPRGLEFDWSRNEENDLAHYALYRGTSADFVPAPENRLAIPTTSAYFDSEWRQDSVYCYKVSAIDRHANESGFALVLPENVTGVDTPGAMVTQARLYPSQPNPFNPLTTIRFDLPQAGRITLAVYDAAGRRVRLLVDEAKEAGSHQARWDGRADDGRQVASGVYVCEMAAGSLRETRRLTLVK